MVMTVSRHKSRASRYRGLNTYPLLWRFRATKRLARVVMVRSYKDRDVVSFRFLDADGELRNASPRSFLDHFERVESAR